MDNQTYPKAFDHTRDPSYHSSQRRDDYHRNRHVNEGLSRNHESGRNDRRGYSSSTHFTKGSTAGEDDLNFAS